MNTFTDEQLALANHGAGAFVEACPGAGKTRAIVERIARIGPDLPPRRGLAVLSFTNSAIEEFLTRCHANGLSWALRHPGFVGTFDSFLRHFFFSSRGIDGVPHRPVVVDSWDTLRVAVRLRGQKAFRGDGVALDKFDAETNEIDPAAIGHSGLRSHVQKNQADYQRAAGHRRMALRGKGYVSAADVRVEVFRNLQRAGWSRALGRALAARFQEVIVDEAQDCNPLDCRIICWLRKAGIAVTVVADPDQAVYGFRHGSPAQLRSLADDYDDVNRLVLTGNFRSSPAICRLAATLRSRATPDISLGETAVVTEPVHLMAYRGNSVPVTVGYRFCELLDSLELSPRSGIVLSHARTSALRACGTDVDLAVGTSNAAEMARAVGRFWSVSASQADRESALRSVERLILELMGQIDESELPSRAAELRGIDVRWLRRSALELIGEIPRTCMDTNSDRSAWLSHVRAAVGRLTFPRPVTTSPSQFFPNRADADWHRLLVGSDMPPVESATIHEAKGREYDAVCVVIPPDHRPSLRTEELIRNWETRTDDEAKRVIYVGVTRAKRLCAIAIPAQFCKRIRRLLEESHVPLQLHEF